MTQKLSKKKEWKLIYESFPGLFFLLDVKLRIQVVSNAVMNFLPFTRQEIEGKNISELYYFLNEDYEKDDLKWKLSLEYIRRNLEEHHLPPCPVLVQNSDGKKIRRYWRPVQVPVFNEEDELLYIIHKIEEVPPEYQETVNISKRFNVVSLLVNDGIYEIDFKSERVNWNDQLYRMLDYEVDEVKLDLPRMLKAIHPDDRENVRSAIRNIEHGADFMIEFRLKKKNGEYIDVLSKGFIVRNDRNQPLQLTASIHDVSGYKKQEKLKAQLELITSSVPLMISYIDKDLTYQFLNTAYRQAFGDDLAGLLGKPVKEVIGREIYKEFLPYARRVLQGHKVEFESESFSDQQGIKYYRSWYIPDKDSQGQVRGFIGLNLDITKEKHKEMALNNASEEKQRLIDQLSLAHNQINKEKELLRGFFMHAPAYISIHEGPEHYVKYMNERAHLYVKRTLLGAPLNQIVSPGIYNKLAPIFDKVYYEQKEFHAREFAIKGDFNHSGTENDFSVEEEVRYFDFVVQPTFDINGQSTGIIVYANEVTDQVHAKKAIEESARRDRKVLEAMPIIACIHAANGHIEYLNPKWYQYTGLGEKISLNKGFENVLHPYDMERYKRFWINSLRNCEVYDDYVRVQGRDGNYRWHHTRIVPITDNDQVVRWIGTSTDIDEQIKANEKKDEFIGIASHELKTPLTSVKAYIQLLQEIFAENNENEIVAHYLNKAYKSTEKLNELITELLDVSRIQSGKMQLDNQPLDVDEMVKDVVETARHSCDTHQILVTGQTDLVIVGDRKRLEQIINNLLSNAIKYSPDSDRVVVHVGKFSHYVYIDVTDFGIGISEEEQERLFEQFYRSRTIDKTISGLGIGLYISLEIAKQHGGHISVRSELGKGATFSLVLPIG